MYTVTSNTQLTSSSNLITLEADEKDLGFNFKAGQYAAINFFGDDHRPTVARCFSIVSSPGDKGVLQFSMRNSGKFTRALTQIVKGDSVYVRGPFGGFTFDESSTQPAIFMAGGIGITPFISIIRNLTETKAANKVTLVYSCRNQDDVPFQEELIRLARINPNFDVAFVISDGEVDKLAGQRVAKGRLSPQLIDKIVKTNYGDYNYYICGPSSFMKGMTKALLSKNVNMKQIVTEAFSQGSLKQKGKIKSWPFNIYVMGAIGIAMASFIVTILDLLKTLPPSSVTGTSSVTSAVAPISTRQKDLDQLVNSLAAQVSSGAPTPAVTAAQTVLPVTPGQPAVTPVPKPVPKLVCKTSPSGYRTCQ